MKRGDIHFSYANNVVAAKRFDNRRVTMVGTCLVKCNKVSTITYRVRGQSAKYLSQDQGLSKITTPVWVGVVPVHDTRSNDSRSNDLRFMHKLYFSLHAHKQTGGGILPITLKDSKILLSNSNRA